jgi:uncharacterized membrane protein
MIAAPAPRPDRSHRPARRPEVDAVRGLVMIVMALDHVRDFLGAVVRRPQQVPAIDAVPPADLGCALLGLAALGRSPGPSTAGPARRVLETLGRVPLFFYVIHIR